MGRVPGRRHRPRPSGRHPRGRPAGLPVRPAEDRRDDGLGTLCLHGRGTARRPGAPGGDLGVGVRARLRHQRCGTAHRGRTLTD
ncbi:hypothetical protein SGPA1_31212 [Streptomyces misionensis JCM 4497]